MRSAPLIALLALVMVTTWAGSAYDDESKPAPVQAFELDLQRASLESVDDKAGRWQFEGGKALHKGVHIANYACVRRIVFKGTDDQNTAMLTTTIFFLGSKPPQNLTLQGAHDYNSGEQIGSVSAASSHYSNFIGNRFTSKGDKILIKK